VDRSAAYAARHIAKNMVAAGVADEMLVQLAYAIGVAEPVGVYVNTYGRSNVKLTDSAIADKIKNSLTFARLPLKPVSTCENPSTWKPQPMAIWAGRRLPGNRCLIHPTINPKKWNSISLPGKDWIRSTASKRHSDWINCLLGDDKSGLSVPAVYF
jgi:hypothetical protein